MRRPKAKDAVKKLTVRRETLKDLDPKNRERQIRGGQLSLTQGAGCGTGTCMKNP